MNVLRVLIVEDDSMVLDTLLEMTRLLGHDPIGCTRATIAKDLLREREFDLLLLDHNLPGMTGLEFIDLYNKNNPMRIVMISGYSPPADLASEITWLQKPFAISDYETLLQDVSSQRKLAI